MENKRCCVVLITHKGRLSGDDERSFKQAIKVLSKRDIFIVIPKRADVSYYSSLGENLNIKQVPDNWLNSYAAYNQTLEHVEFYDLFKEYDYILIYQSDCWVFEDRLDYFMDLGCEWYGAPWPTVTSHKPVGNGGFSLRKVSKMIELCEKYKNVKRHQNEDLFFCVEHGNELDSCSIEVASNFSIEYIKDFIYEYIDDIPMGLHGRFNKKYWDETGDAFRKDKKQVIKKTEVKKCCVVIPTHKNYSELNDFEKKSLDNTINKVGNNDIILIIPNSLNHETYENLKVKKIICLNDSCFLSLKTYNNMMLCTEFYEIFKAYEYMLIAQLDAWIFGNKLNYFCDLGYDYIGCLHYTPWTAELVNGNGGFSLRKVSSFIEASKNIKKDLNNKWDWEDILYSYWYKDKMNIAPFEVSLKFGWQQEPENCYIMNNKELPFGCHKPFEYGSDFDGYKVILN